MSFSRPTSLLVLSLVHSIACSDGGGGDPAAPVDSGGVDTSPAIDSGAADTRPRDVGTDARDGGVDTAPPADKTTGKPCASAEDCDITGLGNNYCSTSAVIGSVYPQPVCLGSTCDPGTDTTKIATCDEGLGLCLPLSTGGGRCYGACSFGADDGTAPTGCAGKDACVFYGWRKDAAGKVTGVGYCYGGCTADADCITKDNVCQKETGICVKTAKYVTYTKAVGDACVKADADASRCNCHYVTKSGKGFCTQFCEYGNAATACPTGFTCDPRLPMTDSGGATLFTKIAANLTGRCQKNCTTDADCTAIESHCAELAGTGQKTCQLGLP